LDTIIFDIHDTSKAHRQVVEAVDRIFLRDYDEIDGRVEICQRSRQ
jgi:hypothetical protein